MPRSYYSRVMAPHARHSASHLPQGVWRHIAVARLGDGLLKEKKYAVADESRRRHADKSKWHSVVVQIYGQGQKEKRDERVIDAYPSAIRSVLSAQCSVLGAQGSR